MAGARHQLLQAGLAILTGVATACFLFVALLGKNADPGAATITSHRTISMLTSPARIIVATEISVTELGWTRQMETVTTSNAFFEARTNTGIVVKVSVLRPEGRLAHINIRAVTPDATSRQLTQQLHDALLLALN